MRKFCTPFKNLDDNAWAVHQANINRWLNASNINQSGMTTSSNNNQPPESA